jgi:transcriptional regulator NrdR family protein
MTLCEACGERVAEVITTRTNPDKEGTFTRNDIICKKCLNVYLSWEKEGRITSLLIKDVENA